jgi:hypothetical protein
LLNLAVATGRTLLAVLVATRIWFAVVGPEVAFFVVFDLAVATGRALVAVLVTAGVGLAVLLAEVAFLAKFDLAVAADGDELTVDAAPAVGSAVQLGAEVALFLRSLDGAACGVNKETFSRWIETGGNLPIATDASADSVLTFGAAWGGCGCHSSDEEGEKNASVVHDVRLNSGVFGALVSSKTRCPQDAQEMR